MAIRHWHPLKIILLWVSYFLVVLITWAASFRLREELVLFWFLLFIPVFAVTWKWATGLQKASNFTQEEPSAQVGILDPPRRSSFSATSWKKIALFLVVATLGAAGGYWYKDFESRDFPDKWIEIRDNPDELSSRVGFSVESTESLRTHGVKIEVGNIETKVKFATARFNRTEDAELLYRGSLRTVISRVNLDMKDPPKKMSGLGGDVYHLPPQKTAQLRTAQKRPDLPDSVDLDTAPPVYDFSEDVKSERSAGTGEKKPFHSGKLTTCDFYLTFELYDKDNFFLVGLIGPRETVGLAQEMTIEGIVEEVIPRQMARRTATIKRNVNFDKCE